MGVLGAVPDKMLLYCHPLTSSLGVTVSRVSVTVARTTAASISQGIAVVTWSTAVQTKGSIMESSLHIK